MSILHKFSPRTEMREVPPNSFYKAGINLIPEPDTHMTRKNNNRPVSLIKCKIPQQNVGGEKRNQQLMKGSIYHDKAAFIPGMQY